ncbi:sensor histidine kinase [Spirochaeta cellobiosiphila]|uniref:sensor histidine kinase n=1 Tax=Spirochaeta cellobiosiphila TaxID=504483 RepID=UPI00069F07AC|nr:histidine kinase [Spirochaeta cellobiosiphila]
MFNKLRSNLLFYSITITLITLVFAVFISFFTFKDLRENNIKETVYSKLKIIVDNVDMKLKLVDNMIVWFSINSEINSLLRTPMEPEENLKHKSMNAYNFIRNSIYTSGLHQYINKVLVGNASGYYIQSGYVNGDYSDGLRAQQYLSGVNNRLVEEPFKYSDGGLVYVRHRAFTSDTNKSKYLGDIFITVNSNIFTQYFDREDFSDDETFFIGVGDKVYHLNREGLSLSSTVKHKEISNILISTEDNTIPTTKININDQQRLLVIYQGLTDGFFIARTVPSMKWDWEGYIFLRFLFFVFFLIAFLIFSIVFLIDKTINIPILHIGNRIEKISEGNFTIDKSIEYENEIGIIGKGVNQMISRIEQLINKRIQDEEIKKNLEFRVLQNQINPHFLYNTLNSIKWMAIAQKTTGIPEMVNSLATLLKYISKGTNQIISLEEEIFLLEQYLNIQSIRFGSIVKTSIVFESEDLKKCKIVKFSLQPIVENAITHGIEPKQVQGEINIHIHKNSDDNLVISIKDNGMGIPEHTLASIFDDHKGSEKSFNHVGVSNVNLRLKSFFGEEYGLTIESRLNEYTIVNILIPGREVLTNVQADSSR